MAGKTGSTLQIIFYSLFPDRRGGWRSNSNQELPVRVSPPEARLFLGALHRSLQGSRLHLFFPGVSSFAAPFLLFRMKREGYSNCTAVSSKEGIEVTGDR